MTDKVHINVKLRALDLLEDLVNHRNGIYNEHDWMNLFGRGWNNLDLALVDALIESGLAEIVKPDIWDARLEPTIQGQRFVEELKKIKYDGSRWKGGEKFRWRAAQINQSSSK